MKLYLNNIGIIKDSEIQLNGLTVITGKNGSGKTTVGRALYSLICAGNNTVDSFEDSRKRYICSQILEIERVLQIRRMGRIRIQTSNKRDNIQHVIEVLFLHKYLQFKADELLGFVSYMKTAIYELTPERYKDFFIIKDSQFMTYVNGFIQTIYNNFSEWRAKALDICQMILDIISDEYAFYNYVRRRTSEYLKNEFNGQIQPVKNKRLIGKLILTYRNDKIVDVQVNSKNLIDYSFDSTFVYPYRDCIFIDNPFVIDRLKTNNRESFSNLYEINHFDSIISKKDIEDHDEKIIKLLMQNEKKDFFDDIEIQRKYKSFFEKINDIVPGEFYKDSNGIYYVNDGTRLVVNNLATGSKMFFIIKKLLLNGLINENTVLVLDEPESHLHPEWINKFAEILVILVKDVKVNVLLTTHSPNLMLALDYYSKKSEIDKMTHFYLANCDEDKYYSRIRCIDDRLGEGYSHLSLPLIEMNIKMEGINKD